VDDEQGAFLASRLEVAWPGSDQREARSGGPQRAHDKRAPPSENLRRTSCVFAYLAILIIGILYGHKSASDVQTAKVEMSEISGIVCVVHPTEHIKIL
jgi:hypothetical protein